MDKKISAVVVTYNRKELLEECVQSLLNQSYQNFNILIVDNCSTDGTEEHIKQYLNERVKYINTGANLGGAGGFNFGIRKAVENGSDYVWIMDDDCIPTQTALEELVSFAKEKQDNFGFLSSVVKWKDDSICRMNTQKITLSKSVEDFSKNQKIRQASFVSLFLKSEVVEDLGLPIKDFFIWGDDWEYTARVSVKYPSYLVAKSVVVHKSVSNIGSNISQDSSDRLSRYFYAYRNEGYFYRKQGIKGKIYYFLKRQLHRFRIFKSNCDCKKERYKIIKQGSKASKNFNPRIEYAYRPTTKVKVLECFAEPLAYGGQEAFMINMYQNFSQLNLEYTFFTPFECTNSTLMKMANERDDKIVACNRDFNSSSRKRSISREFKKLVKNNKFDVVHVQSGSIWALLNMAKIAKKAEINRIIVHSHCTGNYNLMYRLIKRYSDMVINRYANTYFACSKLAGEWKFPKEIIENDKCLIVNNGIDVERFKFNQEIRKKYRKEFGILDNELVLLNVGRFSEQKNHSFIVQIAKKLQTENVKFKFILVGEGELKSQVQSEIIENGLVDNFIFLEKRSDVAEIMCASDIFVLPSLYEGLAVTSVESQASGLPTLCSTNITKETELTDLYVAVELDAELWAKEILKHKDLTINREEYSNKVAESGFSAKQSAKFLEEQYLS